MTPTQNFIEHSSVIAFFDFDRTLINKNSATLWVKYELRAGRMSLATAVKASFWIALYHMGYGDIEGAMQKLVGSLKDELESDMRVRVYQWYNTYVRMLYRKQARAIVDEHRQRGHRVVLLSSTSTYAADLICADLNLHDHLSNSFLLNAAGQFTGEPRKPMCFGQGKLKHAEDYARHHHISLSDCWFYTDSITDLPVMNAVGHPIAVHPDRKLHKEAQLRGWPIADWDT